MKNGAITEQGSFSDLMKAGGELCALINSYGGGSEDEKKKEEEPTSTAAAVVVGEQSVSDAKFAENGAASPATKKKGKKERHKLMTTEERAKGAVNRNVFLYYFQESGGVLFAVAIVLNAIITQGFRVSVDYWLGLWTRDYYGASHQWYMMWFGLLGLFQCLCTIAMTMQFAQVCCAACWCCLCEADAPYSGLFTDGVSRRSASTQRSVCQCFARTPKLLRHHSNRAYHEPVLCEIDHSSFPGVLMCMCAL
jgi:hypothetical protein